MKVSPEKLVRDHLKEVKAYSSARDEFAGSAEVYLDANENSIGSATEEFYNRYPDPHHKLLKQRWSELKGISQDKIFFGNGSDEPIDLLIRLFCEPWKDHVITLPPTYGMYKVSAAINAVELIEVPLTPAFQIDYKELKEKWNGSSKMLFLCTPNNPTGNLLAKDSVIQILKTFPGIVVVDEAYIDFSEEEGWVSELDKYRNLVVLQTLSKAWGMAGVRVGVAMGDPYVISMLEKIKPPYNVSQANQSLALEALSQVEKKNGQVQTLLEQRKRLEKDLLDNKLVKKIIPSATNFLLVKFDHANEVFEFLIDRGVIVRNRTKEIHCAGCLRITVGTKEENDRLLGLLWEFMEKLEIQTVKK
jgi:histidinol-phosphate aminotransferase